jgi:hypothetical protein
MATLAAQIQTELALLVASATIIDHSNQRDEDTAEDTARTAAVAAHASAKVEGVLGDGITDSDVQAVDLGTRIALMRYAVVYSETLTLEGVEYIRGVHAELRELRDTRNAAASTPQVTAFDFTDIDKRYPGTTWGE